MEGLFQAARSRGGGDRASHRRRDLAFLAACALTFIAGAATLAQAQTGVGDAYDVACEEASAKSSAADTFPQRCANEAVAGPHEEPAYWEQIAGAPHPELAVPADSVTPFEADLFAVEARNAREVLAGGARCKEPGDPQDVEACERVPVIYAADEDTGWQESDLSPDDKPGYVGAIAWIGKGKALAVGGTGTYPRREPPPPADKTYAEMSHEERLAHDRANGAGDARAWHYYDGEWHEISDSLPAEMSGLSALDIWIGREQDGDEWGLAGDYGHVWEWEGGQFTDSDPNRKADAHIDRDSPSIGGPDPQWAIVEGPASYTFNSNQWQASSETSSSDFFNYRVREIRIAPDRTQKRAFAFTAGCCGPAAAGSSRRIEYVPQPRTSQAGVAPPSAPPLAQRPRWLVSSQSYYDATTDGANDSVYSFSLTPNRHFYNTSVEDTADNPQPEHDSFVWSVDAQRGVVETSGGPETERPEIDSQGAVTPSQPRYVSSDGDTEPTRPSYSSSGTPMTGDGVPDWKVGEAPADDPDFRGRSVLATTVTSLRPEYGGLQPTCEYGWTPTNVDTETGAANEVYVNAGAYFTTPAWDSATFQARVCRAEQVQAGTMPKLDEDGPLRTRVSGIQVGPSWSLNAIDMLDAENVGYAVGDRGAILRFGEPPAEPDPPALGARRPAPLADTSPYAEHRPASGGAAGPVPSLATQPREDLDDPRMVRAGSPDGNELGSDLPPEDVHTIVMSRDGSEGWAIGPSPQAKGTGMSGGVTTLYHYEAGQWTRCDPVGIPGLVAPDRECSELAPLYTHRGADQARIRLDVAARVPLENDAIPSNDDEFEVLAIGSPLEIVKEGVSPRPIPTVVRYSDGRWQLERFDSRSSLNPHTNPFTASSLACTGPDECWVTGRQQSTRFALYRFTGEGWIDCSKLVGAGQETTATPLRNSGACGDMGNRLNSLRRSVAGSFRDPALVSAGTRVYLGATRPAGNRDSGALVSGNDESIATLNATTPVILYKDHGREARWRADAGGYDPGYDDLGAPRGIVTSLAIAQRPDGRYEGWAVGAFELPGGQARGLARWPLMRLDPETGEWTLHRIRDASYDYLGPTGSFNATNPQRQVTLAGAGSEPGRAYIAFSAPDSDGLPSHLLAFNPARERWELAEKPGTNFSLTQASRALALAPDNRGGIWAAFGTATVGHLQTGRSETQFYNYTTSPPREVFEEVAHPLDERERLTDLSAAADGSLWMTTDQGTIYRRDRITGWERATIPGWDPGRVVTRRSAINAVALGPDGSGLAVGEDGRVALVEPDRLQLDRAAGTVCEPGAASAPCGTGFDLREAAIAPDGSAMVGGDRVTLLWRPAGGELRRIAGPDAPSFATIEGISMPAPGRAWVVVDTGQLYAGTGDASGAWRWRLEGTVEIAGQDRLLGEDDRGEPAALRDVAIDSAGHGFAVGDRGVVLERTGDEDQPWRRLDAGVSEKLTSVALAQGGGPGALIGGDRGVILTLAGDEWRLARPGDQLRPDDGFVAGVALLAGPSAGQTEAWAAVAPNPDDFRRGRSQLLHYTNAPQEALLDPAGGAEPLPDVPAPRPGELSFAAFGRSDCQLASKTNLFPCPPLENGTEPEQTLLRRIRDELTARSGEPGGPDFAVFTGDAYETGGPAAIEPVEQHSRIVANAAVSAQSSGGFLPVTWTGGEKYRRFNEQVTDWLPDRGLPVFGAVGSRDLSEVRGCVFTGVGFACAENRDRGRAGDNLAWRQSMEAAPAPWGHGEPAATDEHIFEPIDDLGALRVEDQELDDPTNSVLPADDPSEVIPRTDVPNEAVPDRAGTVALPNEALPGEVGGSEAVGALGGEDTVGDVHAPVDGAATHYAADVVDADTGEPTARLVVADTSLGSLTASEPIQNPVEPNGGQAAWLERVLCIEGGSFDTGQCTRSPDQQAIVVSTTPTYSYGPTDPTATQADGAVFESILLRHRANVVVSGKLGWNGRYWATAPGLHEPCPGEDYIPDEQAPQAGTRVCGQGTPAGLPDPQQAAAEAQGDFAEALNGTGGAGILPFVVASGAGGRFDEFAERSGAGASDGLWHGYTIVRLHPSGDPRKTVVEQRPVLDWIRLGSPRGEHVVPARGRVRLEAVGREPLAGSEIGGARFNEIDSAAITHRYDLLLADPDRPWAPCEAARPDCVRLAAGLDGSAPAEPGSAGAAAASERCVPYVCLPDRVGAIDRITGVVRGGDGRYPDVFAVALLSVGEKVASYPLVFKRSPSFVVKSQLRLPGAPLTTNAPTPKPPGQPPIPDVPQIPKIEIPAPPAPPAIPSLTAAAPPELQPPAPPAPPPPSQQPTPLDLTVAPPGVSISTPTALIQPPTPPVNPAPPGGARREARQRQAAAQKGGADSSEEGSDNSQVDMVDNPNATHGSNMTRHDHAFTTLARAEQPSAWSQGALYGGGIGLAAAVLALGFSTLRPTPRRRQPELPAPASSAARHRRL